MPDINTVPDRGNWQSVYSYILHLVRYLVHNHGEFHESH